MLFLIILSAAAGTLKILLSFAVGGLLGDVFLHLLPEAWASKALNRGKSFLNYSAIAEKYHFYFNMFFSKKYSKLNNSRKEEKNVPISL